MKAHESWRIYRVHNECAQVLLMYCKGDKDWNNTWKTVQNTISSNLCYDKEVNEKIQRLWKKIWIFVKHVKRNDAKNPKKWYIRRFVHYIDPVMDGAEMDFKGGIHINALGRYFKIE